MSTNNNRSLTRQIKDYVSFYLFDHGFVRALYPNFYSIDGLMFRSSQPSPTRLEFLKKKYGIKTVINLRGENGLSAYNFEKKACLDLGLELINARTYSRSPPQIAEIKMLQSIFKNIEYPALMHCKSGSDRTGVAAALYRILQLHQSVELALKELHWSYGHIKSSHTGVLDYFFEVYIIEARKNPQSFIDWAETYDHTSLKARFRNASWTSLLVDKLLRRE